MSRVGLLGLGFLALLGCGRGGEPHPRPGSPGGGSERAPTAPAIGAVELVDSIPWEDELSGGVLHRVVVRTSDGADTLSGVRTARAPVVVGDSVVLGFDFDGGRVRRGFRWSVNERRTRWIGLPDDFVAFVAWKLAPDGAHLAYVARADSGRFRPEIRVWPGGQPVFQGPAADMYPSDAANSSVRWSGAEAVEVRMRLDDLDVPGERWLRARGSPTGTMAIDTLALDGSGAGAALDDP